MGSREMGRGRGSKGRREGACDGCGQGWASPPPPQRRGLLLCSRGKGEVNGFVHLRSNAALSSACGNVPIAWASSAALRGVGGGGPGGGAAQSARCFNEKSRESVPARRVGVVWAGGGFRVEGLGFRV